MDAVTNNSNMCLQVAPGLTVNSASVRCRHIVNISTSAMRHAIIATEKN
jgi:hypothetical protein